METGLERDRARVKRPRSIVGAGFGVFDKNSTRIVPVTFGLMF
jgi:hypothetical protein